MNLHHHPTPPATADLDSGNDSLSSTPTSHKRTDHHQHQQHVRLMCSFGGKFLPRPHGNQLRYVRGDTRVVSVSRTTSFSSLHSKLSKISGGAARVAIKYQLPNEDLDALVTVASDEDVENMMDEIDRFTQTANPAATGRLRLFLFPEEGDRGGEGEDSRGSSISSLLDGSTNSTNNRFLDALNCWPSDDGGGGGLERNRSEASSIMSEVPDYLFGLESLDEPKQKPGPGGSDTGSPPLVTGPSPSASLPPAVESLPNLPPVKTKPDCPVTGPIPLNSGPHPGIQSLPNPTPLMAKHDSPVGLGFTIQESIDYASEQPLLGNFPGPAYPCHMAPPATATMPMPVYYVHGLGPISPPNAHVHHVAVPNPYVQPYQVPPGQVPMGFHAMIPDSGPRYGGSAPPVSMDSYVQGPLVPGRQHQPLYYGVNNSTVVPGYPGSTMVPGNDISQSFSSEITNANWLV